MDVQPSAGWLQELVETAKASSTFEDLPHSREKTDTIWLMELAKDPSKRPEAMRAISWMQERRENGRMQLSDSFVRCGLHLEGQQVVDDHTAWVQLEPRVGEEGLRQRQDIVNSMRITPFVYNPDVTELGAADRHPWHGEVDEITFGDIGAGAGLFAAVFAKAGAKCRFLAEPKGPARRRAQRNCGGDPFMLETIQQVDPARVPWVHILQGGPE